MYDDKGVGDKQRAHIKARQDVKRGQKMAETGRAEQVVKDLILYALKEELIDAEDAVYSANLIFDALKLDPDYMFRPEGGRERELEDILKELLDDAVGRGLIDSGTASRDLLDTKIMGILTPRPHEFIRTMKEKYAEDPKAATEYFYHISKISDYIRTYRVRKDRKWPAPTKYGDLDITINLSKPEKDPKAIAAALKKKQDSYPKCLLCRENEGYAGRLDHPARQNIRLYPLTLGGEPWFMQYSPYVYYNEHCIVLSDEHRPMKIDRHTFIRLFDFIDVFPHYVIGSNADLPIVGGSILTHEHFQGGQYTFAMAKAPLRKEITFPGFEDVHAGIVNWPMSVIRLDGESADRIIELSDRILQAWRGYSDPEADIFAETDGTPHNTITPIARKRDGRYEIDLVLRNNRTTKEYPLGIFHPHQELHHIKKENIGLIEVMGLAVLPSRLLHEMDVLKEAILKGQDIRGNEEISSHADWAEEIVQKHPELDSGNIDEIIRDEIGIVFARVLEDAGVYKDTEAGNSQFHRFVNSVR